MSEKNPSSKKSKDQKQFGANEWFIESVLNQYKKNPEEMPEQWKKYFGISTNSLERFEKDKTRIKYPVPLKDDETKLISGSSAKILENMEVSLSIPTATSNRTIPVKLLEENRNLINNYLQKIGKGKISFTHIISFAIITSLKKHNVINNSYTEVDGAPAFLKRKQINFGFAIDIEKKDGSHSLIVPNIKNSEKLKFFEFIQLYDDILAKAREGKIELDELIGTTITITNPGTIGTVSSVPRLMLGQGAIIATGIIEYPAQYKAMSPETISKLGISKVINISCTYDHRIIQGAESGLFLKEINDLLLGENYFYENIFEDLKIPVKPFIWESDFQPKDIGATSVTDDIEKEARIIQLINMYRVRGHLIANIDPLRANPVYHKELDHSFHKFTLWDLDRTFITGGFGGLKTATLRTIINKLQKTYCEKIGVEYMHIQNPDEKNWLQDKMEPVENKPEFTIETKRNILMKLIEGETFEHFIHTKFLGHKRFSLEGSETLIPVLDYLLNQAVDFEVNEVVFGMAHRGRLNLLANIFGKSFDSILSEFEDIVDPNSIAGSGDVKYHLGAKGNFKALNGKTILVSVAPNPSHLEWVNPVVEGIVRAMQTRKNDKERKSIIPVLIHGDAAFAGQGVVAETLNLSQLKGYRTGGTIHIIINNQIGFTTLPEDARSSVYATDVARMIQAPIFHVNGDDPEACIWITKLALEYRQLFQKDIVIDLIGYRRHGHNEGDEPGFTQPLLYEKIKNHPSVLQIYSQKLIEEKITENEEYALSIKEYEKKLFNALDRVKKKHYEFKIDTPLAVPQNTIKSFQPSEKTSIDENKLNEIIIRGTSLHENFSIHPKLKKFLEKRREFSSTDSSADWALAEFLAFGSLLIEGIPIRLSGQDSVRGTFSQRHLSLTDIKTGEEYFPLNNIFNRQAKIEALDSLLSESAVLGFEFGYSTADPLSLVIWEAQFGDFANSAQVIIDNFIVASFEKWQIANNLVLLLPHGFEGQGPEHSSARLERFLTLCAEDNMEVCNVSTPAQYFHLLRRHMTKGVRRPLIIMTPKSLLRLPEARSNKSEFINGKFYELIDDNSVNDKSKIKKVVLTSGKIFYELDKFRVENKIRNVSIVRIEQFYPYNHLLMNKIFEEYKNSKSVVWVQEEPKNMGAWSFLQPRLKDDLLKSQNLFYCGRPASASPAVGSYKLSQQQQEIIIKEAFSIK